MRGRDAIFWLCGLLILALFSCKSYKETVTIQPNPVEIHGEEIRFQAHVEIPPYSEINRGFVYTIQPYIGALPLESIEINLADYPEGKTKGVYESIYFTVPYRPGMENCRINFSHRYITAGGVSKELPDVWGVADCCFNAGNIFRNNRKLQIAEGRTDEAIYNNMAVNILLLELNRVYFPSVDESSDLKTSPGKRELAEEADTLISPENIETAYIDDPVILQEVDELRSKSAAYQSLLNQFGKERHEDAFIRAWQQMEVAGFPKDPDADTGYYKLAKNLLEKALQINEDNPVVLNNLGVIHLGENNYDTARFYLERSLEVQKTLRAHYNLGLAYALEGDYTLAIFHFNKSEKEPELLYNAGLAKIFSGYYEEGIVDLKEFAMAFPEDPESHFALAIAGAKAGSEAMFRESARVTCLQDEELCQQLERNIVVPVVE